MQKVYSTGNRRSSLRAQRIVVVLCGVIMICAGRSDGSEWHAHHAVDTPHGIVFTNETATVLCLARTSGKGVENTEELFSGPGCGMYFTVSPDGSKIGFKEIFPDGTQAPALLDIATKKVTLLHPPAPLAGQVAFSTNGIIAYSIDDEAIIRYGSSTKKIPIGFYTNIVAISSDGGTIAYPDGNGTVFTTDVASGTGRKISSKGCVMPIWSPSGKRLCYSSLDGKIFVYDDSTLETYALGNGWDPAWTEDGKSLVVVGKTIKGDSLLNSDLYLISYDGKQIDRLTETETVLEAEPSIGTGGKILFAAYNNDSLYSASYDRTLKINTSIEIKSQNISVGDLSQKTTEASGLNLPRSVSSDTAFFEVPYTNQVWDTPYGFGNLGSSACGPTSAIMVIAYYNLLPVWNCQLATPTRHVSPYGNYVLESYHFHGVYFSGGGYGYMWNSSDPYHMMASYYKYHGLNASELDAPSLDTVMSEINSGHPYTLCNGLTTAGHIIVINGIGIKPGTLVVNDPYGNKNSGSYPTPNGKDVVYDWPGYNNGNQNLNNAYWGVSVRYSPIARSDSIVDDLQFNDGFTLNNSKPASMSMWFDKSAGFDGHEWYTNTRASDTCTAVWRPTLPQAGNYQVSAYILFSTATAARYKVHYRGDLSTVMIDQSKFSSSWATIGTFAFEKGDSGYVELGDGSDSVGQMLIFDAMKWTYFSPALARDNGSGIPVTTELEQNYPNPFNPTTVISYRLSSFSKVRLNIYDVLGREVVTLVDGEQASGLHSVTFDASRFASGVYFCTLTAGQVVQTKKLVLMK